MSPWGLGSVTVLAQLIPGFAGVLLEVVVTCLATIDTEDLEATFVSSVSDMMFRISKRWVQQNFKLCEDCVDGVAAEAPHCILPFLGKDAFDKMMACLGPGQYVEYVAHRRAHDVWPRGDQALPREFKRKLVATIQKEWKRRSGNGLTDSRLALPMTKASSAASY